MFKNMTLVILFDIFLNPSLKMTTRFANIARTTVSTIGTLSIMTWKALYLILSKMHIRHS